VGAWLLPDLVGRATATDLVLTGRRVEAAEALALGLLDRLRGERAANRSAWARAIPIPPGP
jgi:enoyl-CoA hydratase/carnithine racemase